MKPIFYLLDDTPSRRSEAECELIRRYGSDYDVVCGSSAEEALAELAQLRDAGREVIIVFSAMNLSGESGAEFLAQVHPILPHAKRAILVPLSDFSCAGTLLENITFGQAETYMSMPFRAPDEEFHRAVTELLGEYAQQHREKFQLIRVVGDRSSPRSYELRDILARGGIPGIFYDADSDEGKTILEAAEASADQGPVCMLYNAEVLVNPTNSQLDDAMGIRTHPEERLYDLCIVGAGPAGLSAALYAASEGLDTVVIEREAPGGQAGTSSMVRNYLGFPRGVGGQELMHRAFRQAWLFKAQFVFSREAVGLREEGAERVVLLSNNESVRSRAVLISPGVAYRKLGIPHVDRLVGMGVFYSTAVSEAQAMRDRRVFISGAGNSAGQAALFLAKYTRHVTMLTRGDSMADSMSHYLLKEIEEHPQIQIRKRTEVIDAKGEVLLETLILRNNQTGEVEEVEASALFILIGGVPYTDWLPKTLKTDQQGYILSGSEVRNGTGPEEWPLRRSPLPLETSIPGVFAAGDVRHGAPKRIASAVGEGAVAVRYVHEYLAEQH